MHSPLTKGAVGAQAPTLELPAAGGETRSLSEFRGRPVIVSFLGPAHCSFCRAHVIKMIQAKEDIARTGAGVILVAFHDPELLMSKMMHDLDVPFLLLLDRARETYARWGLGRFDWKVMLNPALYAQMVKLMIGGHPPMGTTPHYNQLGGDFVIDQSGKLVYVKRMKSFYDRAPVPEMLAAIR